MIEGFKFCAQELTPAVQLAFEDDQDIQDSILLANRLFGTQLTYRKVVDSERIDTLVMWTIPGPKNIPISKSRTIEDPLDVYYMVKIAHPLSNLVQLDVMTFSELKSAGYKPLLLDCQEPTEPVVAYPTPNALTPTNNMKNGSGISGEFATSANDNELELTIVPTQPGSHVLRPATSGDPQTYVGSLVSPVGFVFAVTSMNASIDTLTIPMVYDVRLIVGNGKYTATLTLEVQNDKLVWVGSPDYILTDSYVDDVTVQNGTRVSFLEDAGLLTPHNTTVHTCRMIATNKLIDTQPAIVIETVVTRV